MWTYVLYVLGGAVAVIAVATILHFAAPGKAIKIPTIILSTLGGLVAGAILGLLVSVWYGEMAHREIYGDLYKGVPPGPGTMRAPGGAGAPTPADASDAPAAKELEAAPK